MSTPDSSGQNQGARFHSLLNETQDMVLVFLSAQINELFASSDEALMDFAEQAENSLMQGRFFEAMGAVRKHRSDIEHEFRIEMQRGFNEFGHTAPASDNDHGVELTLIEQNEMEETVAEENLVMQSRNRYFTELYALSQRMAVLNNGRKVKEEQIPAGPSHLVKSYRVAIASLTIDVKAKIVLYALFDKFVMKQLKGLYDEINSNMKNAGLLPNLKPAFAHTQARGQAKPDSDSQVSETLDSTTSQLGTDSTLSPSSQLSSPSAAAEEATNTSLGEELFDSILGLMSTRRKGGAARTPQPGAQPSPASVSQNAVPGTAEPAGTPSPGSGEQSHSDTPFPPAGDSPFPAADSAGAAGGGEAVVRENLMSAIDSVRPTSVSQTAAGGVLSDPEMLPQIAVDPQFIDNLKHTLSDEREQILSQVDREQMPGIDADTIDLIGMLFEYMLNDPLLPNVAKALLSHLHTPYLKLALIDRQLLVDSEHHARLLLDMLVDAGGQWVYENDIKRGIFPQMQTVVDRVLQEFTDNDGLFQELLEYFRAAMEEQRRKADAIEQRAQESVKGREKLHVAKKRAAHEMQVRASKVNLPKSAERFLTQAWSDRLVFILLRHKDGEHSEDWTRTLQVADSLVWLFDPKSANADEATVRQTASAIRSEIENALDSLGGYHQHYLEELLRILDDPVTARRLHAEQKAAVPPAPIPLEESDTAPESATSRPLAANDKQGADERIGEKAVQQPGLFEEQGNTTGGELSAAEKDMLDRLHKLKFGTWFEFKATGKQPRRLKLSWLSPLTSTCMFVDRAGAQAEVKSLTEIAKMLVSGEAKVIPRPKHQFVERALVAIKKTLQRSMESTE